jgi:hypothetical protein
MDTKKLVVGQEVTMTSGCYSRDGKVVRVTWLGAEVQTGVMQNDGTWNADEVLHFNRRGKGRDEEGTYECGPYFIDEKGEQSENGRTIRKMENPSSEA